MRKNLKTYQIILLAIGFIVLVYALALAVISMKFAVAKQNLETQLAEQRSLLISLAEITARNGTDSVTDSILKDCAVTQRTEFDALLGSLDQGLSPEDLFKLERLFGRCGSFYSEKKALLTARLNREIEIYATFVDQLDILNQHSKTKEYKVEDWKTIASLEQKQSLLFMELVSLQSEIIQALIADNAPDSQIMKEILTRVQVTQEALAEASNQVVKVQATLES